MHNSDVNADTVPESHHQSYNEPSTFQKILEKVTSSFTFLMFTCAGLIFFLSLYLGLSSGLQERLYQLRTLITTPQELTDLSSESSNEFHCSTSSSTTHTDNSTQTISTEDDALFDDLLAIDSIEVIEDTQPATSLQDCLPNEALQLETNTQFNGLSFALDALQISSIWLSGQQKSMLALLLAISLISATLHNKHLSLRTAKRTRSVVLIESAVSLIVLRALGEYLSSLWNRDQSLDQIAPYFILFIGFTINLISLIRLIFKADKVTFRSLKAFKTQLTNTLFQLPLYCWMILIPFLLSADRTPTQLALLIGNIFELPQIYLQIALYIWVGLLFQQSKLVNRLMDSLLNLPLNNVLFIICIVALMAFPTAFTGASGILILAFGALIYKTLSQKSMRKQQALAITALTGSTGVVLTPSLLIVAIAFMNRDVTTSELFHWGGVVFLWTLFILLLVLLAISHLFPNQRTGKPKLFDHLATETKINSTSILNTPSLGAYAVFIGLFLCLVYALLAVSFNEFSAPYLLILLVIGILFFEKHHRKSHADEDTGVIRHLKASVGESLPHSGAILMIMLGSFTLANTSFEPSSMDIPWLTELSGLEQLTILLCVLVIIGMILEPFGALALVSITLAPLAYEYGLHPIHFWMIAVVAFELGYVTPPVAMNHLLAQQQLPSNVLPEAKEEAIQIAKGQSILKAFYLKHERVLIPIIVLSITLLSVTFIPLMFNL